MAPARLPLAPSLAGGDLPGGGGTRDKALLVVALKSAIKDKKFFLVLDDMWGVDEWEKLLMTPFSYGGLGSRVLITTRHDTVRRSMKVVHYHHVDKLGPEDAWSLLKKQVLTSKIDELEVDMLSDIGLQIAARCDGLPLAVKVMGGLLCKKEKTRHDWEDVLNSHIWSVSQMPEELNYAIYLSYEDLPPFLKQCFLHFSLKPKKTILGALEVVSMWIGEGIVQGDACSIEEGRKYYMELILRNLIEIDPCYPGQFICNMHDVIRSFAQFLARDEALVANGGDTTKNKLRSNNFLRLSIETRAGYSDEFEWRYLSEQKSLRTLILSGRFKIQPGDSLVNFSSLRTLSIESANCAVLVESVCQLKHLRFLRLKCCSDLSGLPENIHEMKFLQHIGLEDCGGFVKLPSSVVKLQGLRCLDIDGTHVDSIPRGFYTLTNLRALFGFPTYTDGDWCSLEELGPLSQLMELGLKGLDSVSATSSAEKARLGAKAHPTRLDLKCGSRLGDDGLLKGGVSEEEVQRIEVVFDVICPLPCIECLLISGYFGRQLPRWMMWRTKMPLQNLRALWLLDLSSCTQLPDRLCWLPCLEFLKLSRAPAIKHVGREFVQPYNRRHHASAQSVAAFPRLHEIVLEEMVEWEEWEWEEQVHGMPSLELVFIRGCKLRRLPPGLAYHARSLKKITIFCVNGLHSLENFASVVELELYDNPYLTRISNFPKLQKLEIDRCPKVESLQDMNALLRLTSTNPSHLLLDCCNLEVLASMALGKSGSEWDKFSHIKKVEAYANDGDIEKKWHLIYIREPYNMETNIVLKDLSELNELS